MLQIDGRAAMHAVDTMSVRLHTVRLKAGRSATVMVAEGYLVTLSLMA